MNDHPTALIADDEPLLRAALRRQLASVWPDLEIVAALNKIDLPAADPDRYADEIEQSYCRRLMAATSAMIAWTTGDWDVAVSTAEMELVERGSVRGLLGSRDALGFVAFGRGDVGRAQTLLGDSLRWDPLPKGTAVEAPAPPK